MLSSSAVMTRMGTVMVATLAASAMVAPQRVGATGLRRLDPTVHVRRARVRFGPQIIGGADAPDGSFPWAAYIQGTTTAGDGFACSGTVISSNLVLTAGHCAFDVTTETADPAGGYLVATGALDWADAPQVSTVTQTYLAPGYDPSTGYLDAAILQLATPTTAPTVTLATPAQTAFYLPGDGVAMAGWGMTDADDPDSTTQELQWAPTVVQGAVYCEDEAAALNGSFDPLSALCTIDAPYEDDAFCHGDSGGPIMGDYLQGEPTDPTQIGIISRGNCSTSTAGISTRVDVLSGWAQNLIAQTAPPSTAPTTPITTAPTTPTTTSATTPITTATTPTTVRSVALGRLSTADARVDVREVLAGVFDRRFTGRFDFSENCDRDSQTRVSCGMNWAYGPTDYWGSVTVFLTRQKDQVVWTDTYRVKSVSDYCYFHSVVLAFGPFAGG